MSHIRVHDHAPAEVNAIAKNHGMSVPELVDRWIDEYHHARQRDLYLSLGPVVKIAKPLTGKKVRRRVNKNGVRN